MGKLVVNNLPFSEKEVLKMVYYFQNKSIFTIICNWIRLKFNKKLTLEDIKKEDIYEIKT